MTTVKIDAEIDGRGNLRLEVPVNLPAGKAEVLVVVQPVSRNGSQPACLERGSARSGLFANKPTPSLDIDAALDEMNGAWKSKLTDLS